LGSFLDNFVLFLLFTQFQFSLLEKIFYPLLGRKYSFSLLGKNFTLQLFKKSLNILIEIHVISRRTIFHDFIGCENHATVFYEAPAEIMQISTTSDYIGQLSLG
jgi:hypothetical protein